MNDIYTIKQISEMLFPLFKKYSIENVYLFGSYSRGEATASSDVDLYIPKLPADMGLEYFGMYDDIEQRLQKSIDIVTDNTGFINEKEKNAFFGKLIMTGCRYMDRDQTIALTGKDS